LAKVVSPLLSVEARGRMGGLVYGTWHGISTVKAFSSPNQPNSQAQLDARATMSLISVEWQTLTQAQRDAWGTYADANLLPDWTGNPKRLTAMNWFVKCNVQLERMGESHIPSPPAVAAPDSVVGFAVAQATADITAAWTSPVTGAYQLELIRLGPVSIGMDPKIEHAIFDEFMEPDETTPFIVQLAAAAGRWRYWCRLADEATGLVSPWVSDIIDVT